MSKSYLFLDNHTSFENISMIFHLNLYVVDFVFV